MTDGIDVSAAALTSLILSARQMALLVSKGIVTQLEAENIIRVTAAEIAQGDPQLKAACAHALKTVFPGVHIPD